MGAGWERVSSVVPNGVLVAGSLAGVAGDIVELY
jgi:hypothetical protein